MLLEVRDLAVARGGVPLLEGLSFALRPGQVLLPRGANGIGKTSLLRTIAGLQPPLAGQVIARNGDIAYASHADGIKAALSVGENLRFWARVFGLADIDAAVRDFDLGGLLARPAGLLSAGQKRRLGLARLVLTQRRLWLLDEPTVSLDRAAVALLTRVLGAHLKSGGAALIATHVDIELAAVQTLELEPFRAAAAAADDFDAVFL